MVMKTIIDRLKGLRWAADKQRNGTAQGCENAFEVLDEGIERLIADVENPEPKKIPLSKGKFALVDAEDYPFLSRLDWYAAEHKGSFNAAISTDKACVYMTRLLVKGKNGYRYHHKNGDTLDNRKENIVLVPHHTTSHKSKLRTLHKGKPVTSKYKGVWKSSKKAYKNGDIRYMAGIAKDGKTYHLGTFRTQEEAALAYNKKARELYGELAYQNDV